MASGLGCSGSPIRNISLSSDVLAGMSEEKAATRPEGRPSSHEDARVNSPSTGGGHPEVPVEDRPDQTPSLTIAEAAEALNISATTCRRWIRTEKLKAMKVKTKYGFIYQIPIEAVDVLKAEDRPSVHEWPPEVPDGRALLELVERQQSEHKAEITKLHDAHLDKVTRLSGQLGFLQAENGQLKEQVKLLEAPPVVVEPEPKSRHWYWLWMRAT